MADKLDLLDSAGALGGTDRIPVVQGTIAVDNDSVDGEIKKVLLSALATWIIAQVVDAAPGTLDTLNEIAAALGDDPNFAVTMTTVLALKANVASPTLAGTPAAPTAAPGTNTTQIATTAFVEAVRVALLNGVSSAFDTLAEVATDLALKMVKSANLSDVASAATAFGNIKQAASDAATGVVELADATEVLAGNATDRAIVPAILSRLLRIHPATSIADDTALSFSVPALSFGLGLIFTNNAAFFCLFHWSTNSNTLTSLLEGSSGALIDQTTGALAGTTGIDTHLTISIHTDNKIYVENRLGGSSSPKMILLGGQ